MLPLLSLLLLLLSFIVVGRMGLSGSRTWLKGNYVIRLSPEYLCVSELSEVFRVLCAVDLMMKMFILKNRYCVCSSSKVLFFKFYYSLLYLMNI